MRMIVTVSRHRYDDELVSVFRNAGWDVRQPNDEGIDLLAVKGAHRYGAHIKFASEARRSLLEGLLASAILRARVAASAANAQPLAILAAPSISDVLLEELSEFVHRFGEGVAWGAMDDSGLAVLQGPGLRDVRRERKRIAKPKASPRYDFMSDLGQWMLKVLLSHRLPGEFQVRSPLDGSAIDRACENASVLSEKSSVSSASAFRFVASMKEERFLVDNAVLNLLRREELLEQWRSVVRRRPAEQRVRWLFPQRNSPARLDDLLRQHLQEPGSRACVGLFAACDRLGFRFVSGVAPHLYLESVSPDALRSLGLRRAEPGESADLLVREPRYPEAVFRGALKRDGVPVTDVIQCWLDVHNHPARGEEMASHLFDHVIGPRILEDRE